ncbi:Coenzyme F420 hydrogenase/dehydrogenase, beta subunit C-terminal domain [Desulfoluna spongiiphila]|uniref:Coenzyme F420 hydrogenase/dehydrogenase, beta subunit C-terminal domain n=1 Tax=Desulfoluna spongiiphila TaxID=419481 RepID=UPI001252D3F0|nr:Coenzyme F420 hydrogenase/dehydrogenase, beta subunit C-terminal domain [Desulfoluna spongiiphila]VVS93274.1 coenzyme f420 hydrogenase/dehydrogenase beta subunit c-terminal [Desulfoluna spongiiphila]
MEIRGGMALLRDVQEKGLCVDCGGCVGLCPYFRSHRGRVAMLFDCNLEQGRCHVHCPKAEVDMDAVSRKVPGGAYTGKPAGRFRRIVKSRAGQKMAGRARYQNGGTVSSLLALAFDTGLIDAAALTDRKGLMPRPRVVTDVAGVLACASSKYMASPTVAAVHEAFSSGFRRIAMVGTPCQVTAVGQMRCDPLGRNDMDPMALTIGLFCTWALDARLLSDLMPAETDTEAITGMDVPPPPSSVFSLHTRNGPVDLPLETVRRAIPDGCRVCPDMTAEFTDLSVGALEKDTAWNVLICRTEAGEALFETAVARGYLETVPMDPDQAAGLLKAASAKKARALAKVREEGALNRKEGPSVFHMAPAVVDEIMNRTSPLPSPSPGRKDESSA